MCSLKSLHCVLNALLDSPEPFCTAQQRCLQSFSLGLIALVFNLFPSPFFCVTNFNAVYLESQRYYSEQRLFFYSTLLFFSSFDFFPSWCVCVIFFVFCCCSAVALCASWRFVYICVFVLFFHFLVSFWGNAELAELLLSIPIVLFEYELPIEIW